MKFENGQKIKEMPVLRHFWDKSFLHYTWVSALFSLANIFFLWLLIDVLKVPTVISSTIVIGGTFLLRYIFFKVLKIV